MHAKHRSPGHGFRSNSTALGPGTSGISSDNSGKAAGYYNSEYRSFNSRAYGRGRYKPFHQAPQSPQLSQKTDILMEAGKLAAEYLVSKGLLPSNSLPAKWKNDNYNKSSGEFSEFKADDLISESRSSANIRLGNNNGGGFDSVSGRRRYSQDFNARNHTRTRRRGDFHRNHVPEWSREHGSSGPWYDRSRVSSDVEDDTVSDIDNMDSNEKLNPPATDHKPEEFANRDSRLEENCLTVEGGLGESTSGFGKDKTNVDADEAKDQNYPTELKNFDESTPFGDYNAENEEHGDNVTDLAKLCRFSKVPTKTRSALISRMSNTEIGVDMKDQISQNSVIDHDTPVTNTQSCDKDLEGVPEKNVTFDGKELESGGLLGKCLRSVSFQSITYNQEIQPHHDVVDGVLGRASSVKERGEKRNTVANGLKDIVKKQRDWLSPFEKEGDQISLDTLSGDIMTHKFKMESSDKGAIPSIMQENLVNSFHYESSELETPSKYSEEKQFFPSSFKICDLNLIETSHVSDIHCSYSPVLNMKNDGVPVGIDLSMNSSSGKDIEVIDLENDSSPEQKRFDMPLGKVEGAFVAAEGIPMHGNSGGVISDVQDSYDGLMMSEFLSTFSSCQPNEDMNTLPTGMELHGGEGALGEDDSIYMSLEEIPLSFIPAWQQPATQEYDKPF